MSEPAFPPHPPEFRRLCEHAVERFRTLPGADIRERAARVAELRGLLQEIEEQVEELDLRTPEFAREQGLLMDAASALQSIDLDRGGPHVARYVERAVADLRRVAGGETGA